MAMLEMKAETEALIAKLPTLFHEEKRPRCILAPMLVTCYGAVGNFPKAIAACREASWQSPEWQNHGPTWSRPIRQKNEPVLEQLIKKLSARVAQDPESKKDPSSRSWGSS